MKVRYHIVRADKAQFWKEITFNEKDFIAKLYEYFLFLYFCKFLKITCVVCLFQALSSSINIFIYLMLESLYNMFIVEEHII